MTKFNEIRSTANPGFRFMVQAGGSAPLGVFTECTLPTIEWTMKEVKEGGVNDYVHQLPGMRKKATLTLKNGIGDTELYDWCTKTMMMQFERKSLTITMMNVAGKSLMKWNLIDVLPSKWTAPALKSDDNTIAIQTIELVCHAIEIVKESPAPVTSSKLIKQKKPIHPLLTTDFKKM